jgi:hypothetical protein
VTDTIKRAACISKCGEYRFVLHRDNLQYSDEMAPKNRQGRAVFVMLNPSTADAREDDPTIRRCMQYSIDWGFNNLTVVNLFPLRATDPKQLRVKREPTEITKQNLSYLEAECYWNRPDVVVCAWGQHGGYLMRDKLVLRTLVDLGANLTLLKRNEDGTPAHPLYLRKNLTPIAWSGK